MVVLGVDVGTQGARALLCDAQGIVLARTEVPFTSDINPSLSPGWSEQHPSDWWQAATRSLRRVSDLAKESGVPPDAIAGLSVTSTSGTVCLVDEAGEPVRPALMYNDGRALAEAEEAGRVGAELAHKLGYRFSPSFALPKLIWLQRHEPARFRRARYLATPTDFIIGRLTGSFGVTDYTNALKTGYDLVDARWPDFIASDLGIPQRSLPWVVPPGTAIGTVSRGAAEQTELAAGTPVFAGMTDGCASQVSTGAVAPGQWSSTLGTTLVIKGVTRELIRDPRGRVYCHRHPEGFWLPGGASNTGGEGVSAQFDPADFDCLNAGVLDVAPTSLVVYPLARRGERFPFAEPEARGFAIGEPATEVERYAAHLEGVAYVERLSYEVLETLGAEIGEQVYVAGGATASAPWLQLRADVLGKVLRVPTMSEAAFGAAVVAAGSTLYEGLVPAARAMARIDREVAPRLDHRLAYDQRYARFCQVCRERGYL
jgi:xylulokinase